jgi:hypothetical protein
MAGLDPAIHAMTGQTGRPMTSCATEGSVRRAVLRRRHGMDHRLNPRIKSGGFGPPVMTVVGGWWRTV